MIPPSSGERSENAHYSIHAHSKAICINYIKTRLSKGACTATEEVDRFVKCDRFRIFAYKRMNEAESIMDLYERASLGLSYLSVCLRTLF